MHVGLLLVPVQPIDVELRALMEVDGFLVQQDGSRELVHLADDGWPRLRGIDDHDVVGGDASQMNLFGGKRLAAPEPPPRGSGGGAILFEKAQQLADVGAPQPLLGLEGELEQSSLEMPRQQEQVVRVDQPFFWVGAQEVLGVADDELVQRRAGSHENAHRPGTPSRPSQLLPGGRDRSRIADQDRRLQAADIDPQLQRIGADDSGDISVAQPGLDLAPMEWEIPGAVATHPSRRIQAGRQVLAEIAQHHLDLEPAAAEQDGLHAGAYPWRRYTPGFEHRAPANAHLAADERRVVEDESPLAARCAAPLDELDVLLFEQLAREVEGVGDCRRRADESWGRPIKGADSFQASNDVGDLASKQSAIRVQLIDDDEIEAREQSPPPRVVRQDARVQHVRVGDDDVAGLADRGAATRRSVAVIRVDTHIDRKAVLERAQLRQLVL